MYESITIFNTYWLNNKNLNHIDLDIIIRIFFCFNSKRKNVTDSDYNLYQNYYIMMTML